MFLHFIVFGADFSEVFSFWWYFWPCCLAPFFCSSAFYSSKYGYKMCLRLYLNGDGTGRGTHLSLFFVVMRGKYDALLKWPFSQKVNKWADTLSLFFQAFIYSFNHLFRVFLPTKASQYHLCLFGWITFIAGTECCDCSVVFYSLYKNIILNITCS